MIYFIVGFFIGGIVSTILWYLIAVVFFKDDDDKTYPDE